MKEKKILKNGCEKKMDVKKILSLFLIFAMLIPMALAETTPTGNPNTLCMTHSSMVTDENAATGGCVGAEDATQVLVTGGLVFFFQIVGLAALIVLVMVLGYLGIKAKTRKV